MHVGRKAAAVVAVLVSLGAAGASSVSAQERTPPADDTLVYRVDPVIVTATRGPRLVSQVPRPVSVLQRRDLLEMTPNTVSDLFRTVPGLDVTGVGVQQVRPQIRGQSGQRILLLSDGLRMNNTRRQRDFGELPALVDINAVEQVEVVRGPASVLYGSDAIAGVVNIITETRAGDGISGTISGLYGSASELGRGSARLSARSGTFSLQGGATLRRGESYEAPAGSFGNITLSEDVTVHNTGVDDFGFDVRAEWDVGESVELFAKVEHYEAEEAGFGYVDPEAYSPGDPTIQILYPDQRFQKLTLGVRADGLGTPVADAVNVTTYGQDNERELIFDAFIPFFPGAGLELDNRNFTDIRTYGFRAEARKLLADRVLLTYGVDGFRDRAEGTDNNTSTVVGFGPPQVETSNAPSIPNAEFLSLGAFVQGEVDITERLSVVLGGRYQDVSAETFVTPNLSNTPIDLSDNTVVWAANAMYEIVDGLSLIGSIGRGFRSPNLVELFFDGAVAEAGAYQIAAPDLEAEKSLGWDLGARYVQGPLFLEGFYFRNEITDGIRGRPVTDANGDTIQTDGLDTYQNVNIDEVVLEGFELNADLHFANGIELGGSLATLDAEDVIDPENPIGESYSTKLTGRAGYRDPAGRFWARWETRHSGKQKDAAALGTDNPLGTELPAFTVHNVRAGARLAEVPGLSYGVTVSLENVTDELYAETANGAFFRPEPGRSLTIALDISF